MDKKNDHVQCTLNDGAFITASSSDVSADFTLWFLPIWVKIIQGWGRFMLANALTADYQ